MDQGWAEYLGIPTRVMLDFLYDGVYIVDRDRNIVLWNKAAETLTGHLAPDVLGKCCRDNILNHLDSEGKLLCEGFCPLQRSLDTGESCQAKVFPLHHDGHRFPVETHIGAIRDHEGTIIGAIEVFRDISLEEQFRNVEAKFRQVIHRYVSDLTYEAAQNAADGQSHAPAGLKELTVLFIDIVGFTALSEAIGAVKTVEVLNRFFDSTSLGVKVHLGDIDKFIGDCALAIFPDPADAVAASEEFLGPGLAALNLDLVRQGLPPVNVRIGINTGTVVQGTVGADSRRDLTVIGDVVNTASRVEGAALPGTYLITESTLARLPDQGAYVLDKEILLKGKSWPVKVYRKGPPGTGGAGSWRLPPGGTNILP